MDLKQLDYIVAIADHGNITKAAEAMFITQSGLNQQLIRLENELGIQLFYRTKRHLHPTQAGQIYIESAREILKIKKNAYSQIGDLVDNTMGELSFGIPFEHGIDMFIHTSTAFNQRYPGITVRLAERTVGQMHVMLASGLLDIAFVMLGEKDKQDNEYIHLCDERLVLGIPREHPLASLASPPGSPLTMIDLKHFKNEKFSLMFSGSTMRGVIDPLFETAGFRPNIIFETMMNHAMSKLAGKNLCCTIIPQSYAQNNDTVAWFALSGDPHWEWVLALPKHTYQTGPVQYMIELSREYARDIEKS